MEQRAAGRVQTLDRDTCLALLATVVIGRVAWMTADDDLRIVPVNFVLDGDGLAFRTDRGGKLAAIEHGAPLTFEADDVEPALRVGWSVVVSGRAQVVADPEEVRRLERFIGAPWAAMSEPVFVRLPLREISGRRIPLRAGGVVARSVEDL
ncbi:pyridoxamine 5'-phosphate oxidase family protein [Nonomuraea sp. CA-218870]|uniref:pyridoxamine 5'-phosphate oxidase family protein n=1 Tax=Nonomuraea sp. CA-218870 TaxID=3239998 RepID=UPI003D92C53B